MPKTPEGISQNDELDLLYKSKYEMEDSADEKSPPASQIEPRHKTYYQNKQENSQPNTRDYSNLTLTIIKSYWVLTF